MLDEEPPERNPTVELKTAVNMTQRCGDIDLKFAHTIENSVKQGKKCNKRKFGGNENCLLVIMKGHINTASIKLTHWISATLIFCDQS